jgi:5-methylcytosine-specific restriction endonuclease McrA
MPAKIGNKNATGKRSYETRAKMRAAKIGKKLSPEHRATLLGNRRFRDAPVKGECVYCGNPATTRDHVIPRGRPGWDDPDNIVLACSWCNFSKGDRTPEEWFDQMKVEM